MPTACDATVGRETSNVLIAGWPRELCPSLVRASRSSSFSLPPSRHEPGTRHSSRWTSAVWEARRPCFFTFAPLLDASGPRRDDERGVPARAELPIDARDHHVYVGDPAVRGPSLLAVQYPLVLGLVVACARPNRRDVGSGIWLRGTERPDPWILGSAEALRHPLHELVGRAGGVDRRHGEGGAHDRHPDPGIAPEELLVDDRHREPCGIHPELSDALEAVEADLRRLLDHRPRSLLALIPFGGRRAHHPLGEAMDPVAHVALVLAQLEVERPIRADAGALGRGHRLPSRVLRVRRFHGRNDYIVRCHMFRCRLSPSEVASGA